MQLVSTTDERTITLFKDLLCNDACSVTGGLHNVLCGLKRKKNPKKIMSALQAVGRSGTSANCFYCLLSIYFNSFPGMECWPVRLSYVGGKMKIV